MRLIYCVSGLKFAEAALGVEVAHSYPAAKQPNGNYRIRRIDIFKACERKNPQTGQIDKFDESWLADAVRKFNDEKRRGYVPPVHIDHHDKTGTSREPAGQIAALYLGQDDEGVTTLFADLVNIPRQVMGEIVKMRLPYRSIEVNNPAVHQVSSLALMRTVVPFHHLPITQVSLEDGEDISQFAESANRVLFMELADDRHPGHLSIVQKFGERKNKKPLDRISSVDDSVDGDIEDEDYLSDEELAELLALAAQSNDDQDSGDDGSLADGAGDYDQYDLSPPEAQELGEDGLMALAPVLESLLKTNQQILAKLDMQQGGGPGSSPQGAPVPPSVSAEPKTNAVQFAEGLGDTDVKVAVTAIKMLAAEHKRLAVAFSELQQDLIEDQLTRHFAEQIEGHVHSMAQRGYGDSAMKDARENAWDFVRSRLAQGVDPAQIDVSVRFSQLESITGGNPEGVPKPP
ncbi:MAG: hypothetical protein ABIH03_06700, partial [Pseudomonadota bacterium]